MQKYSFKGYQELLGVKIPIIEMIQTTGRPKRVMLSKSLEEICGLSNGGGINNIIKTDSSIRLGKSIIDVIEDEEFINLIRDNQILSSKSIANLKNLYILKDMGCVRILKAMKTKTPKAKKLNNKSVRAEYFNQI